MGKWFGAEGPVISFINKVGSLMGLSLLWLLCSILVVTAGTSTIALYYAVVKGVRFERGYAVREFFQAFKRMWKKGIVYTLLFLVVIVVLLVDREYSARQNTVNGAFMILVYDILFIFWIAVGVFLFPLLSRFDLGMKQIWKMAVVSAVKYLPYTLGLLAIFLTLSVIAIRLPLLAILLFPGAGCYMGSYLIEPVLRKYMPEPETEEEKNEWYYQ